MLLSKAHNKTKIIDLANFGRVIQLKDGIATVVGLNSQVWRNYLYFKHR